MGYLLLWAHPWSWSIFSNCNITLVGWCIWGTLWFLISVKAASFINPTNPTDLCGKTEKQTEFLVMETGETRVHPCRKPPTEHILRVDPAKGISFPTLEKNHAYVPRTICLLHEKPPLSAYTQPHWAPHVPWAHPAHAHLPGPPHTMPSPGALRPHPACRGPARDHTPQFSHLSSSIITNTPHVRQRLLEGVTGCGVRGNPLCYF